MAAHAPKLLDQVRQTLRIKHYAIRTEQAYTQWIKRFILVRSGKGNKDRDTLLPDSMGASLQRQLRYAQTLYQNDLEQG